MSKPILIQIPEDLHKQIKVLAAENSMKLKEVYTDALIMWVNNKKIKDNKNNKDNKSNKSNVFSSPSPPLGPPPLSPPYTPSISPPYNPPPTLDISPLSANADIPPKGGRFSDFWSAYPKKEAKKQVFGIWVRLNLDKQADEILQHVEAAKKTRRWLDGFIPNPHTYLNQERWKDDIASYGLLSSPKVNPVAPRIVPANERKEGILEWPT